MNNCDDEHSPMYKITYKPTTLSNISNEWFVCEKCFGKEEFFGKSSEIESITSLCNSSKVRVKLDHSSPVTEIISETQKTL
ncbi:MAG: hypothetical protein H8D31_06570 [Nitrosopumilus sp.]|nr:hypothetical protein [Nitrosopumilus sp.]